MLRRWRALCKLLDNEEAGGGDGGVSGTGEAVKGALDGREQTIVARVMLTSAKVRWQFWEHFARNRKLKLKLMRGFS